MLELVHQRQGLASIEQAAEWLIKSRLRKQSKNMTGRGRALYQVERNESHWPALPPFRYTVCAVKSRTMSAMFKEITYMCKNPDCGHVFVAGLEVLRPLSLSAMSKPESASPCPSTRARTRGSGPPFRHELTQREP